VDSVKKATQLDAGRAMLSPQPASPLHIHIQVNTSGEESKSGVTPGSETLALAKHIKHSCPNLKLLGLMTIGAIARSKATGEGKDNEDFQCLIKEKEAVENELGLKDLELSMGNERRF
jgi:uncharacterized pyridoxal phosphate-containing UPF0001 family protein